MGRIGMDTESVRCSEQQEWTPEYVDNLLGQIIAHGVVKVADAHNAALAAADFGIAEPLREALAAEREEVARVTDLLERAQWALNDRDKRREQAVRSFTHYFDESEKLHLQLLSAQSAIEKHDKHCGPECVLVDGDLSALHEHDAEVETRAYAKGAQHQHREDELVREPLVEALEGIAENADHYADDYTEIESLRVELRGFAEQARIALAKVKE